MEQSRLKYTLCCLFIANFVPLILTEVMPTLPPRLDLTLPSPNGSLYGPMVALPGGEVLVADTKPRLNTVVRLDSKGRVVPPVYTSALYGEITGLVLQGDILYVFQPSVISRTHHSNFTSYGKWSGQWIISWRGKKYKRFRGQRRHICPGALVGGQWYLVDKNLRFAFSLTLRPRGGSKKRIIKTGFDYAMSLTTALSNNSRLFYVSDEGRNVSLFDQDWNLRKTFGSRPRQVLVTPWSTILLAQDNNVTEYDLLGNFIRRVLTSRDGLYSPFYISYSYPFLWVTHYNNYTYSQTFLKRFRIAK